MNADFKTCRVCLRHLSDNENFDLIMQIDIANSKSTIEEILREITSSQIFSNDGHPQQICVVCLKNLKKSYEFITLCQISQAVLKQNQAIAKIQNEFKCYTDTFCFENKFLKSRFEKRYYYILESAICQFCDELIGYNDYVDHLANYHLNKHCCDIKFETITGLFGHIQSNHSPITLKHLFQCKLCLIAYEKKSHLIKHLRQKHIKTQRSENKKLLKMKTKNIEQVNRLDDDELEFLNQHVRSFSLNSTKNISEKCEGNSSSILRELDTSNMILINSNSENSFQCVLCPNVFYDNRKSLRSHISKLHLKKNNNVKNEPESTPKHQNSPEDSSQILSDSSTKNNHISITTDDSNDMKMNLVENDKEIKNKEPMSSCPYCINTYAQRRSLFRHILQKHSNEKQNGSNTIPIIMNSRENLSPGTVNHLVCLYCPRAYINYASLKRHMYSQHRSNIYEISNYFRKLKNIETKYKKNSNKMIDEIIENQTVACKVDVDQVNNNENETNFEANRIVKVDEILVTNNEISIIDSYNFDKTIKISKNKTNTKHNVKDKNFKKRKIIKNKTKMITEYKIKSLQNTFEKNKLQATTPKMVTRSVSKNLILRNKIKKMNKPKLRRKSKFSKVKSQKFVKNFKNNKNEVKFETKNEYSKQNNQIDEDQIKQEIEIEQSNEEITKPKQKVNKTERIKNEDSNTDIKMNIETFESKSSRDCFDSKQKNFFCEYCKLGFKKENRLCETHYCIKKMEVLLEIEKLEDLEPKNWWEKLPIANNYDCHYCSGNFKTYLHLRYHIETIHKNFKSHFLKSMRGNNRILCHICGITLKDSRCYDNHLRIHTNERPFECDICHKIFTHTGSLWAHKKFHSESSRSYQCEICGFKTFTSSYLWAHRRRSHGSSKTFECKICTYKFTDKEHLTYHIKDVHSGTYTCNQCFDKVFYRRKNYLRHMRLTHLSKPSYQCEKCLKKFGKKMGLERHISDSCNMTKN